MPSNASCSGAPKRCASSLGIASVTPRAMCITVTWRRWAGDRPGRSDVLEAPPDGLDRLKLAIETIGYSDRAIEPATLHKIPEDCAVVADFGATSSYTPAEVQMLRDYLLRG